MLDVIFVVFIALWSLVAIGGFLLWLKNRLEWERARRYNYIRRFRPDNLGNYDKFYDPETTERFTPRPGNKAFPDNYTIQAPAPANTPARFKRNEPTYSVNQLPIEEYLSKIEAQKASTSLPLPAETSEVDILRAAKFQEGLTSTQALIKYFGLTGGSKFSRLAKLFNSLQESEAQND